MTRKHYKALGNALMRTKQKLKSNHVLDVNLIMEVIIAEMSYEFKADNSAFDRGKFYRYVMEDKNESQTTQ